jgi:catechol 2,3-dioxygenase-like lactoylglutathione lyase family enzyme
MIDHLEIQSRDVEASARFYSQVLETLGYRLTETRTGSGFGDEHGLDFFIAEGEPSAKVHFAFRAQSRRIVDTIYDRARASGLMLDREPALAPHVHPDYYSGYLRDPDGRLVEFVCHNSE